MPRGWTILPALALVAPSPCGALESRADSSGHNMAVIEFLESPPTGLVVSGGSLGVPDSAGRFPSRFQRFDPATGNHAPPGRAAGNCLVFTDLRPGTYRVALVLLEESKLARRLLPTRDRPLEDRCLVYGDTIPGLTFTVGDREVRYLGRLTRRSRPALEKDELWRTTLEWAEGDERQVLKALKKRKDLAPWGSLLARRLERITADRATRGAGR